jgi:hypothetical protein
MYVNWQYSIGKTYGRLTVLKKVDRDSPKTYVLCKCVCGSEKVVLLSYLRNDNTRSCGCLREESNRRNFSNWQKSIKKRYGKLTVLSKADRTDEAYGTYVKCRCDCGNVKVIKLTNLRTGNTTTCGCSYQRRRKKKP